MTAEPTTDTMPHDPLTDHAYDGIQEYDNPLPGWWKWLFVVTIIFSPIYYMYFHMGPEGRSIHDKYDQQMADVFELRFSEIGVLEPNKETILKYMNDEKWVSVGQIVYTTNCVSCHGKEGQGNVGPNLTDNYWKNVTSVDQIAKVIDQGAANGAMPAWGARLHPNQVVLTAAYVASLSKNPKDGKAPEGRLVESWE